MPTTGETNLNAAIKGATGWYLEQLDRVRKAENIRGRSNAVRRVCVRKFIAYMASRASRPTGGAAAPLDPAFLF